LVDFKDKTAKQIKYEQEIKIFHILLLKKKGQQTLKRRTKTEAQFSIKTFLSHKTRKIYVNY
jgi:hypothetical protein